MNSKHVFWRILACCVLLSAAWAQTPVPAGEYEPPAPDAEIDRPLSGAQVQRLPGRESSRFGMLNWGIASSFTRTMGENEDFSQMALYSDLDYNRSSAENELSVRYSGGALFDVGQQQQSSNTTFHNFAFTNGWTMDRWTLTVGDAVSYQPQSQGAGGTIPGLGQYVTALPFSNLNPNLLVGNSTLVFDSAQLGNSSFGQAEYHLSRTTSATFVAAYGLLRYIDYSPWDCDQWVFTAGLDHELRSSRMATRYTYARYGYTAPLAGVESHAAEALYQRELGRYLTADLSAGPQLVLVHGIAGSSRVIPSGAAALTYGRRYDSVMVRYQRGVNSGAGFMQGAIGDAVEASVMRQYRRWSASVFGSYLRNAGFSNTGKVLTRTAEARIGHNLGENFRAHVSYGYQSQSNSMIGTDGPSAFRGGQHTIGGGITWYPKGIQLR